MTDSAPESEGVEVYFRNPQGYVRELVEAGVSNIAWDRGYLVNSKIDPLKHADLYFPAPLEWSVLAVGTQGTAEYHRGDTWFEPSAVYPTWEYGDDLNLLEELMASPVGANEAACNDKRVPGDERPVFGQPHKVVIVGFPSMVVGPGRAFAVQLRTLQEDYPDCTLHLHGLYSYRVMFGMGFKQVDVDPRTSASKGKITLPGGGESTPETAAVKYAHWIKLLGYKPVDLKIPRNRCIFNIKAAQWAATEYMSESKFRVAGKVPIDTTSSDAAFQVPETKGRLTGNAVAKPGDRFHCNSCSLSDQCKYFRDGAVCSVPGAEPKELATFFKTRDADTIIEGLGILTQANARRLQRGMNYEEAVGDTDKEVTKLMGQVFDQGMKLAKLIDPNLRSGARVQVNVGPGAQAAIVGQVNPKQLVAGVIRELESQGYRRDQITPEMIQTLLSAGQDPEQTRRSIEAGQIDNAGRTVIEG